MKKLNYHTEHNAMQIIIKTEAKVKEFCDNLECDKRILQYVADGGWIRDEDEEYDHFYVYVGCVTEQETAYVEELAQNMNSYRVLSSCCVYNFERKQYVDCVYAQEFVNIMNEPDQKLRDRKYAQYLKNEFGADIVHNEDKEEIGVVFG